MHPVIVVALGVAGVAVGTTAQAQVATGSDGAVQELVVTAERRSESAINVPVTTTSVEGESIGDLRLHDLRDLAVFVPGLQVTGSAPEDVRFEIRGISSDNASSFQEPRVSVFHNSVSVSRTRTALGELFDVARVEVSRGPQSTLFGRAALIGAVQIFDNPADPSAVRAQGRAEIGDGGQRLLEGMANLPLSDSLALRGSFRLREQSGDVTNAVGGERLNAARVGAGRISATWRATPTVKATLFVDMERDTDDGLARKSHTFAPSDPLTGSVVGSFSASAPAALAAGSGFEGGRGLGSDRLTWRATQLLDWTLSPKLTVSSITGYVKSHSRRVDDRDGTSLPLLTLGDDSRSEDVSQEVRTTFTDVGPFSGTVGAFYGSSRASQRTPLQYDERALLGLLSGYLDRSSSVAGPLSRYVNGAVNAKILQALAFAYNGDRLVVPSAIAQGVAANLKPDHAEEYRDDATLRSVDLYADVSWRIASRLRLDGGLRYGRDDKESGFYSRVLNGRSILGGVLAALNAPAPYRGPLFNALALPTAATRPTSLSYPVPLFGLQAQPTAGNGERQAEGFTDDGLSWRLAADYALSQDAHIYATYGRGRRPAVLDPEAPRAPGGDVVFTRAAAETVDSVEAGLKTRWFARRLSVDVAAYGYRYEHFQTLRLVGTQFLTQDAGRADALGLEAQAAWRLGANASIFANYAFNHARFGAGLYDGNTPAFSPDHAGAVGVKASMASIGGRVEIVPTLSLRSRAFFTDDNSKAEDLTNVFIRPRTLDFYQKGYGLLDSRITYVPRHANWTVGLFANNLTDTHYLISAGDGGQNFGLPTYLYGARRLIGVSFTLRGGG